MFVLDGKPLALDRAFEHNGIKYPSQWLRLASPEDRAALGIIEQAPELVYDQRFYWGYDENNSLIPKDLDQLKEQWTAEQKRTANTLLAPTDWLLVRRAETGAAVPSEMLNYRDSVRSVCNLREAQIEATETVEELKEVLYGEEAIAWPTLD